MTIGLWERLRDLSAPEELASLRRPGAPPRAWLPAAGAILGVTLVAIGLMLLLGSTLHGKTGYFFRERKAGTYLSFALLVSSGVVSALMGARLRGRPFARFWWTSAGLFVYMGCDGLFVIHDRLDRWTHLALGLDPEHPVTDHLDDAIVGTYGLVALAFVPIFWASRSWC